MRPEGHLATAAGAASLSYLVTGSWELAAGVFTGGFLIDLDHYVDYFLVEGQRSLNPFRFLDYYLSHKMRYAFLPLHSYELMASVAVVAFFAHSTSLLGYLLGAAMHLALDIRYNGFLRHPVCFYSLAYRYALGFKVSRMLDLPSLHLGEPPSSRAVRERSPDLG